ncbi:MAG: hypothetical protein CHACPFDD_00994 [Phycisphaerae bacterium]|nr:hypothetical protein [Phycisphaerae bacterium]
MAEETKPAAGQEQAKPKKKLPMTMIIVAGAMTLEAVAFFVAMKFMGSSPAPTHAEENPHVEAHAEEHTAATVEVSLLKRLRVPNSQNGRNYMIDLDLSVIVRGDKQALVEELVKTRMGEIQDRLSQIVRAAEGRLLAEPDLQGLRIQFKAALDEIIGDPEVVQRVLVPRFVPILAD